MKAHTTHRSCNDARIVVRLRKRFEFFTIVKNSRPRKDTLSQVGGDVDVSILTSPQERNEINKLYKTFTEAQKPFTRLLH